MSGKGSSGGIELIALMLALAMTAAFLVVGAVVGIVRFTVTAVRQRRAIRR